MSAQTERLTSDVTPPDSEFGIDDFNWDAAKPEESLHNLYIRNVAFAKYKIRWYHGTSERHGRNSKRIRLWAIILLTLGSLCPLVAATKLGSFTDHLGAWGYVLIALAAGIFGLDRFYGISSTWTRDTSTWLAIRKTLVGFQHDWVLSLTQHPDSWPERLELLKQFRQNIETAVVQECAAWAVDEERRLATLQNSLANR